MRGKELRKEFRNTEIGKKLYKKQNMWGILFIIIIILYAALLMNEKVFNKELFDTLRGVIELIGFFLEIEFLFALGAYNGAYKYFKWEKENEK